MLSQVIFWLTTIWPKRSKHFEHYPTTNHELFVLNYVPHYSFSNSGMWKGQNSPVCFTALFTAFFFCWTFPTFHFNGEGFFCQPWGWWNYFEGSTGVGTGETRFSLEFSDHNYYSGLFDRATTKLNHNRYASCWNNSIQ